MSEVQDALPEGLAPPGGRPRDDDRPTRRPVSIWDRVKFLLLLGAIWFILVWSAIANFRGKGGMPFSDAARLEARTGVWVFVLLGLEAIRQMHYLVSEHWAGYHRFWTHRVFGGFERLIHRKLSDWSRFRLRRVLTWVFWIAVIAVVIGKVTHTNPVLALLHAPIYIWHALPTVLQYVFLLFFLILQFAALFWFLSRGGVDVYYPDDIKTRFSDVWGQDHVLERVKENILYLEHPERVEDRGGYVPGGILLWGPPGTGKTLMAEAVAGETGRPYVFVDPGAFINMFFGVGVLKVKGLFRKLRKLALRYGGVIVFFDEADSLGNRGALAQGGQSFPRASAASQPFQRIGCHGLSYLSTDMQGLLTRRAMQWGIEDEPGIQRDNQIIGAGMGGGGGGGGSGGSGTQGIAYGIALWSNPSNGQTYAFLAANKGGSAGNDVTKPAAPAYVKVFAPYEEQEDGRPGAAEGTGEDVKVLGDNVVLAYGTFGVLVYRISDLIAPVPAGIDPQKLWDRTGSYDYRPKTVSELRMEEIPGYEYVEQLDGSAMGLSIEQTSGHDVVWVAYDVGVARVEYTDPQKPVLLQWIAMTGAVDSVHQADGRVYVSTSRGGLWILK